MVPRSSQPLPHRRPDTRGFAWSGVVALIAATTLAACGPRDDAPLASGGAAVTPSGAQSPTMAAPPLAPQADPARLGSPVPTAQGPTVAVVPAPAAAPAPMIATAPATTTPIAPAPAYMPPPPVTVTQDAPDDPALRSVAPVAQPPAVPRNRIGSVVAIDPIRTRPQGSGAGAVIGGVLGGVIGNQFGHGLGRAAMTGVGAAGGAVAGNNVERNYKEGVAGYRVHIRLDNGSTRTFERKNIGDLHVGDRVRLDANGFRRS